MHFSIYIIYNASILIHWQRTDLYLVDIDSGDSGIKHWWFP